LQRVKILYAEDYDLVLFTVKQWLEAEDWAVDVCRDGEAALKKITGEEHYDLLILDERLRGVSGVELIRRARRSPRLSETPIVVFTAVPCDAEVLAAGANAFLKKPSGLKDLLDTCRRLLGAANGRNGGAHAEPERARKTAEGA
jgi:CheY-like chemotaxis protein